MCWHGLRTRRAHAQTPATPGRTPHDATDPSALRDPTRNPPGTLHRDHFFPTADGRNTQAGRRTMPLTCLVQSDSHAARRAMPLTCLVQSDTQAARRNTRA